MAGALGASMLQSCTSFANNVLQDAHLPVCAQLDAIGGSKDALLPVAMPIAGEQPVACFAGMAFARPVDEVLLQQIIVSTHSCGWDDSGIVGCPAANQGIELRNHPRLRICLQPL